MIKKVDFLFILVGVIIILIFLAAPQETTNYVPYDDEHKEFNAILSKDGKGRLKNYVMNATTLRTYLCRKTILQNTAVFSITN